MMEDLLNCKHLYDPIEGDNAKPSEIPDAKQKKLKNKTLGVIGQWVDITLQPCCQIDRSPHSLEEIREHV